jgi:thioredoxin 1
MPSHPTFLSPADLNRLVSSGQPALVEFYTPTCPHCQALEPTIEALAREWGERLTIAQLDLSEHPKAAREWQVMGTPTVLVFDNGEAVARLMGVQPKRQYVTELQKVVDD